MISIAIESFQKLSGSASIGGLRDTSIECGGVTRILNVLYMTQARK